MAFYRNKITYADLAPKVQKFRSFLQQHAKLMNDPVADNYEAYFFDAALQSEVRVRFQREFQALTVCGFIQIVPFYPPGEIIYIYESEEIVKPTISATHIRLPKLSCLITLVPHDFFAILRLIDTAKNTPTKDSLSLNFPAAGLTSLTGTPLEPFFLLLRTNYRMNPDYADRKWTLRSAISTVADLDPTFENQLFAMQYLTTLQNDDLLYFPCEAAVTLDIEFEQINNDYCRPILKGAVK